MDCDLLSVLVSCGVDIYRIYGCGLVCVDLVTSGVVPGSGLGWVCAGWVWCLSFGWCVRL